MTQNRAREAGPPVGSWLPCRQAHRSGGWSVPLFPRLCIPGQLFYQTRYPPDSQPQPQQETPGTTPAHCPDLCCQGPKAPTPIPASLGQGWMSTHCSWICLEFSQLWSSSQQTGGLLSPQCQRPPSEPLSSFTLFPCLWFPHFSCLPPCRLLTSSLACLGFSSSSLHLSLLAAPLCAFSRRTPNGKHLFPGALRQSLLLFFLRHPALTVYPELIPVFLPFLPRPRPHPQSWGIDSLFLGYLHPLFAGRALLSGWS